MSALVELRDKVKAGDARMPDFIAAFDPPEEDRTYIQGPTKRALDAYNGSLDAALALHEAVLPGEGWSVNWVAKYPNLTGDGRPYRADVGWGTLHTGRADTPARAWLLAILEALIAEETRSEVRVIEEGE